MKNNSDISSFISDFSTNCSKVQIKKFNKGETITTFLVNRNQFCVLISGSADLVRYDYNGNRIVTERFSKNSIFGEIFYHINTNSEFVVEAKEKSEVLLFSYDDINEKCKANCPFHEQLKSFFPNLVISKITELTSRIELLSRRTTRDKLLGYFNLLSKQHGKSFTLPFSITELANYLVVDRSSMTRELSILKKDEFIKQERNKITLLYWLNPVNGDGSKWPKLFKINFNKNIN